MAWAPQKYGGAAKRKVWPKEVHLKPEREVSWERVETNERNFHFLAG